MIGILLAAALLAGPPQARAAVRAALHAELRAITAENQRAFVAAHAGGMAGLSAETVAMMRAAPRCEAPRDARGFKRSQAVLRAFVRESPQGVCPATGKRALPCPGYEAHHLVWLVCGGRDEVANLVWLTVEQHDAVHARTICKARCVP